MADQGNQAKPISLFYSYSHRDEDLRLKLETHLSALRRGGLIAEWHDRKLEPGAAWKDEIDRHLTSADIVLLLVSSDFIASDYCWGEEMTKALERHGSGEARVIPVILRHCRWQSTPLEKLQAVPRDAKPIRSWSDEDEAFDDVVAAIERAVQTTRQQAESQGRRLSNAAVQTPAPAIIPPVPPESGATALTPTSEEPPTRSGGVGAAKIGGMLTAIEAVRHRAGNRAAVAYVHGFTGRGPGTWSDLAPRLADHPQLASWDAWTVTYGTSWLPDISGMWSADASLDVLALRLATDLGAASLAPYKALVLIAHSMGGLVVQKALIDHPAIADRTSAVILFGTPSGGLRKARALRFWKRQLEDMTQGGPFIARLRADWDARFGAEPPFRFLAVAGEKDQFVPPASSIEPFPDEQRAVISGNHVTMIHPPVTDPSVVDLVFNRIVRRGAAGNVADPALVAIETGDFRKVVHDLLPRAEDLDERSLVRLAIALDALGRRDEAYRILEREGALGTDVIGTLAGRHKRSWLFSGRRRADAEAAEAHYANGYALARERGDLRQAYYHGINLAFLAFVFRGDRKLAKTRAREVLGICADCRACGDADEWLDATEGEAELILGDTPAAFDAYRRFVAAGYDPWKIGSTYLNARMIARDLGDRELARELGMIFHDPQP